MYNDKTKLVLFKMNIYEDNSISDDSLRMVFSITSIFENNLFENKR